MQGDVRPWVRAYRHWLPVLVVLAVVPFGPSSGADAADRRSARQGDAIGQFDARFVSDVS